MRKPRIPHVKAGDPITADLFNEVSERLERFANLSTSNPYIRLWDGPYGKSIALALPQQTWALLSGSSSPYSFTEVRDGPGGTWVSMPNGDSGTSNVYEINGKSGLAGKVVPITWTAAGDWRFQWVGYGGCLWTFTINDLCTGRVLPGSLISVSQGGIEIANCTTDGQVVSVTRGSAGANYTSVPTVAISGDGSGATATADMEIGGITRTAGGSGYTAGTYIGLGTFTGGGGSGATFTFGVAGGAVQPTLTMVNRGSGYTSAPTPNFSAAGAGTGATASVVLRVRALVLGSGGSGYTAATVGISGGGGTGANGTAAVAARCTLDVPAGDYDVTVDPPADTGYAPYSNTLTHTCGQATTISLDVDSDHTCLAAGCGPCTIMPKAVFITWNHTGGFGAFSPPDDTLTLGATILGGCATWYGATTFPDPFPWTVPVGTSQLVITAGFGGSLSVYSLPDDGGTATPVGSWSGGGTVTCEPFAVTGKPADTTRTDSNQWGLLG